MWEEKCREWSLSLGGDVGGGDDSDGGGGGGVDVAEWMPMSEAGALKNVTIRPICTICEIDIVKAIG